MTSCASWPGDVVFSFADAAIKAIGIVATHAMRRLSH